MNNLSLYTFGYLMVVDACKIKTHCSCLEKRKKKYIYQIKQ